MIKANKNLDIVFLFSGGRISRTNNDSEFAKDFFYGFFEIKKIYPNSRIVEIQHHKNALLKFFDRVFKKITSLPISFSSLTNTRFKNVLDKPDVVILVNESVMMYSIPYLSLLKFRNKNLKIHLFTMGLFSNVQNNTKKRFIKTAIVQFVFLKIIDKFLFLGRGEYNFAVKKFKDYEKKFDFVPFCIDTDFWKPSINYSEKKRKNILFIGNDLNRDYDFLQKFIKEMPEFDFKILTSRLSSADIDYKNVNLVDGSWWENKVSDLEIRKMYSNAILTIIPLVDTLQPSGQSVALQSMASKTPVMITKTSGFWDEKNFKDNSNIFFLKDNDVEIWKKKIIHLVNNQKLLKEVSESSSRLIYNSYNLNEFKEKVLNGINLL